MVHFVWTPLCFEPSFSVSSRYLEPTKNQELIIGDGGENIAPVPIEDQVKASCDGINEAHRIHGISMSTVADVIVQVFKIRPSK